MSQIGFIHLREHDENGNLLSFGGATIAYQVHRMSDSLLIKYAVAECNISDRFRKDAGRGIAHKRLLSGTKENLLGEIEINVVDEEDIEQLIVTDYIEYKKSFLPGVELEMFLYPHHPGYTFVPPIKEPVYPVESD